MFYEETQAKIQKLITNNKWEEALGIINDELKVPYIPKDFETFLLDQKENIEQILKINQTSSLPEFSELLKRLNTGDQLQQVSAVNSLALYNIRPHARDLENYLLRNNVPQDLKSLVLLAMEDQGISESIKVLHNGEEIIVKPNQLPSQQLLKIFDEAKRTIGRLNFDKNQSWENIAFKVTLTLLLDSFPIIKDLSGLNLGIASAVYADELLGKPTQQDRYETILTQEKINKHDIEALINRLRQINN